MPKLPRISGSDLIKLLASLGTLNDILTRVSLWNNIPQEELIRRLS